MGNELSNTLRADDLLVETIDKIFAEHCTPERLTAAEGHFDATLWNTLEESGLTLVGVPEQQGGSGGTLHDAAAIMTAVGYHAAPVPLSDSMIAARLRIDAPVANGIHVAVAGARVPWLDQAAVVVGLSAPSVLRSGHNYAAEPYAVITADSLASCAVNHLRVANEQLALARSLQIAGALQRVSELCVQYATEREQFGKPIGKQQILQHYLAQIAGEAVTAQAAADNAVDLMAVGANGGVDADELTMVIAAAKVVSSRAVGTVNRLAHQLHGAIGYTDEHRLQFWTRRLWAWRDDFGTEAQWAAVLGRSVCGAGGQALWPVVTSWPRARG